VINLFETLMHLMDEIWFYENARWRIKSSRSCLCSSARCRQIVYKVETSPAEKSSRSSVYVSSSINRWKIQS